MVLKTRRVWFGAVALLLAVGVPGTLTVGAAAATAASPCSVTNTATGVTYPILQTAISRAAAGRTLRVTGTCTGTVTISKALTLRKGASAAILRGNGATVLTISGGPVRLIGLRITGGTASVCAAYPAWVCGGGIANSGTLFLTDTTVSGNTAAGGAIRSGQGGGIYNAGTGSLTLTRSTVSGNTATSSYLEADGAGIVNEGVLRLDRSTVSGNTATSTANGYGGGIFDYEAPTLVVISSTISGNSVTAPGRAQGGGLSIESGFGNSTAVTITDSTISGNSVSGSGEHGLGGGIFDRSTSLDIVATTIAGNHVTADLGMGGGLYTDGTPLVSSTIIAGNTSDTGRDCTMNNPPSAQGYNVIGSGASCLAFQNGVDHDRVGTNNAPVDAKLGPLAANGGPTRTRALLPGSPAIDAGPISMCQTKRDQRGVRRPQGAACDIGSFERR
jgi:hypothetical protein